jgi:hypothetical protein
MARNSISTLLLEREKKKNKNECEHELIPRSVENRSVVHRDLEENQE